MDGLIFKRKGFTFVFLMHMDCFIVYYCCSNNSTNNCVYINDLADRDRKLRYETSNCVL